MSNKLLIGIVIGIIAALAAVLLFGGAAASVYWVGKFFLRALQMLIIPLVMLSVIAGITELGDVRKLGRLGAWTAIYYAGTMLAAAALGLVVVNVMKPGIGIDTSGLALKGAAEAKELSISDIILSFVSHNIFESMAKLDILPVIIFSLAFGIALSTVGEVGKPLVAMIKAGNETMMKLVRGVMWLAPIGVFGLVAGRFGEAVGEGGMDAFYGQLSAIGSYVMAVLTGLAIHAVVVLPLLLLLVAKRNPLKYARGAASPLITAFSTASSSATLPVTMDAIMGENKVDPRAARFVLPLGATLNMDGSALYEAMAAMFIAQAAGIELTIGQQALIVLTASLAAMGAAGIPEAGLVTMIMVLTAVNLPLSGLELLLPIDWFLDRFRTSVNVWGDCVGAGALEQLALDDSPVAATEEAAT